MASMSCCKAGASLPSDSNRPCLVFLITLEGSVGNVDGINFYRAPRWAPNVLVGLNGQSPLLICLQLVLQGTRCSTGTKGALPVDHTLAIKSVRTFKISNQFSLKYSETTYLYLGSKAPFIDIIPSIVFTNENIVSIESI